ncbi:ribosome small subunit-dependent GTPase A [bacterium]|nr:ribosome small subunit-dependent GTPase A [bacterium]
MNRPLPGWRPEFKERFVVTPPQRVGRITEQNRHHYQIATESGPIDGEIAGKLLFKSNALSQLPTVGDWVAYEVPRHEKKGVIQQIFPRFSKLSRKVVGKRSDEQVLVANIDQVLVVQSADDTFNVRRIERFAVVAKESGASVAIGLTKVELATDIDMFIAAISDGCPGMPIFACSSELGIGLDPIRSWIEPHHTVVVLGPSGVGKSTLINQLIGQNSLKTQAVNERHFKGTHTTTKRQLIELPSGGIVIDTPGLRELQIWDASDGIQETFDDIHEWAVNCRFSNCTHVNTLGCAVEDAVQSGKLSPDRRDHYVKLQLETKTMSTNRQRLKDQRNKRHLTQAKKGFNLGTKPTTNDD